MIKKCIIVLLISLIPSLGLGQDQKATKLLSDEQQYKVDYLNEVIGIALEYTPITLKLYEFVFDWIGKPYRFGGESKKGIDCSALTKELYNKVFEIYIPRNSLQQYRYVQSINKNELQTGDLVFFKIKSKTITHVGIYLGDNKFIQSSKVGVNIASLEQEYWSKYYYKGGRINKI
jgi:lipoprotein Spr